MENFEEFFRQLMQREHAEKLDRYRILNQDVKKGEILFTGSSLMENFPINELMMTAGMTQVIYNRAIGGFTTADMLAHMEETVFGTKPSRIFINIGTNDISAKDYRLEKLLENYEIIIRQIRERLPETEVFMMAYYPDYHKTDYQWGFGQRIKMGTSANGGIVLPASAAVMAIIDIGSEWIYSNSNADLLLSYAKENHLQPTGIFYMQQLVRTNEEDGAHRYMEAILPIIEAENSF